MHKSIKLFSLTLLLITQSLISKGQNLSLVTQGMGPGSELVSVISSDVNGEIYYGGVFSDTVTIGGILVPPYFDNSPPTFTYAFLAKQSSDGNSNWAMPIGGPGLLFVEVEALETDATGNLTCLIRAVILADTLHVGNIFSIAADGSPSTTIILKLDPQGNLIWSKILTGVFNGLEMKQDSQNEIYLAGWHAISFAVDNISLNLNPGSDGHFIMKFQANGTALWGKTYSANSAMGQFTSMAINQNKEIFISSVWEGDSLFIQNQTLVNPLPGGGNTDRYIAKFDSLGNVLWLIREGGATADPRAYLRPNPQGGVMAVAGVSASQTVDINLGTISVQGPVMLFSNYNSQGNYLSHKEISFSGGSPFAYTQNANEIDIAFNFNSNQLSLANNTFSNAGGTNGTTDIVVLKLDNAANFISATQIASTESDFCSALHLSANQDLLIGANTAASQLVLGQDTLINAGFLTQELFIARISNSIGLSSTLELKALSLFPNPSKDIIFIQLPEMQKGQGQLTLQNMQGQVLLNKIVTNNTNGIEKLDLSLLRAGMYVISLDIANTFYSAQFLKH